MTILGVDVGTTGLKMGVFRVEGNDLSLATHFSREYAINTYNDGLFSDIEPDKWREAFIAGCGELRDHMGDVDAVALSGTTPGMTAMDAGGDPVYPAILMLDQRSRKQARHIIDTIGLDELLRVTGNMPVSSAIREVAVLYERNLMPFMSATEFTAFLK